MKTLFTALFSILIITGCSVSAKEIKTASYTTVQSLETSKIEIRRYDPMILAETSMMNDGRNSAFRRLFKYISGENVMQSEIAMTSPVIIKEEDLEEAGKEIAMTAPVLMDDNQKEGQSISMTTPVVMDNTLDNKSKMSFVLPSKYTMETVPIPTNDAVTLREVKNYNVAAIRFNGTLSENNVKKHRDILTKWLNKNHYKITGDYRMAGYNAPFTLPWLRRNEVLIPIDLK